MRVAAIASESVVRGGENIRDRLKRKRERDKEAKQNMEVNSQQRPNFVPLWLYHCDIQGYDTESS